MTLDLLISIYRDGIEAFSKNIPAPHAKVNMIIVHQVDAADDYDINQLIGLDKRQDITYIRSHTKGVTISRNIAIEQSTSDIVLFCDDDVVYVDPLYELIKDGYQKFPVEFITYAYQNLDGIKFPNHGYNHNYRSILGVGTIEISCRREFLMKHAIRFPEDMGAGQQLFLCDEPVFLARILAHKGCGVYVPHEIGTHLSVSSGMVFNDIDAFKARLLCFKRIFGKFAGSLLYNVFLLKNLAKFSSFSSLMDGFFRVYR